MMASCRTLVIRVLVISCLLALVNTGRAELDARTVQIVNEELIPAYQRGNVRSVLDTASSIVRRMDEADIPLLDKLLADQDVPQVGDMLIDARLTLASQQATQLPQPSPHELRLAVPALATRITADLDDIHASPVMSEPASSATSFEEFDDRLWNLHVIRNQLRNADVLADLGKTLARASKKRARRRDANGSAESIADFDSLSQRIKQLDQTATQRRLAERAARLEFSLQVLNDSDDLKQRFYAAFAGDLDGRLLTEWLSDQKGAAAQPDLLRTVKDQHEAVLRTAGADLVQKSQWLFVGMHWWLRGRYGMGPDGHGMLKDPMALRSPEAMFGLYMPIETPKPTDPQLTNSYSVPEIDRRHHYIWMYQYQKIRVSRQQHRDSQETRTANSRTKLSHFY